MKSLGKTIKYHVLKQNNKKWEICFTSFIKASLNNYTQELNEDFVVQKVTTISSMLKPKEQLK